MDLLLWQRTDLGYKVIVNNEYQGLIFLNQVFQRVYLGEHIKGYIANIRQDGKLDISLQLQGRQQTLDFADELLQYLKDHNGHCDLWDKSDAEDIYQCFGVSKKVFKKAVGDLYKKATHQHFSTRFRPQLIMKQHSTTSFLAYIFYAITFVVCLSSCKSYKLITYESDYCEPPIYANTVEKPIEFNSDSILVPDHKWKTQLTKQNVLLAHALKLDKDLENLQS